MPGTGASSKLYLTGMRRNKAGRLVKTDKTKMVKRYVKKQIDAGKETGEKLGVSPGGTGSGTNYANYAFPGRPSTQNDLINLNLPIPQGDKRDNRSGSKVKLVSHRCEFMFHVPPAFDATSSASASIQCRLLVLSARNFRRYSEFTTEWSPGSSQLYRKYLRNGSEETSFQGDLWSLQWPVNTANFITHADKRFTLNRGRLQGLSSSSSEGCTRIPDVIKRINVNLKVKNKKLEWSDADLDEYNGYAPFAILLYAPTNGSVSTTSPGIVNGNCYIKMNWKDM
ncbi:MAG: putative capsid protein [Cressdnaviricota sp.]|nr:MAG: putative capsid protein [Cressdnaviricota sp.]